MDLTFAIDRLIDWPIAKLEFIIIIIIIFVGLLLPAWIFLYFSTYNIIFYFAFNFNLHSSFHIFVFRFVYILEIHIYSLALASRFSINLAYIQPFLETHTHTPNTLVSALHTVDSLSLVSTFQKIASKLFLYGLCMLAFFSHSCSFYAIDICSFISLVARCSVIIYLFVYCMEVWFERLVWMAS